MHKKPKAEKQRKNVERVAWELYDNRHKPGKRLDKDKLWKEAEKIVRSPIKATLFASKRALISGRNPINHAFKVITWDTPKWLLLSLPQLEWMKLLAVPLAIAAAGSIITGQIQREANQNAVLKAYFDKLEELTFKQNLLAETPNEGAIVLARGRTVATLRELDLSRRTQLIAFLQASDLSQRKKDLSAPVISFKAQNLSDLDLRRLNLSRLDFQEAILVRANLEGADLMDANLKLADLWKANLEEVQLATANLELAYMKGANLNGGFLDGTNLKLAYMEKVNLKGAGLWNANLEGAKLYSANLEGADLYSANLKGADLYSANLEGAQNLTQDQISKARLCRTILPDNITIDPNRDCKEMGIDPETGDYISP